MTVLVDSNVILDIFTSDPVWYDWSVGQLNNLVLTHDLAINDIVYAEVSRGFETFEQVDAAIGRAGFVVRPLPRAALFLASRAFLRYRRSGGERTGVLSDFFIGAQAAVEGLPLVTRDLKRYRSYFPTIELITP